MRIPWLCLVLLVGLGVAGHAEGRLRVCVADVAQPPFVYWQGGADALRNTSPQIQGLAVDVLKLIAGRMGRDPVDVTALPLRRCLAMVASGQMDMVANVPTAQIDPKPYLITESYFTLTSEYFYWKPRFPDGVTIKVVDDLLRYRVCGIAGYNYEAYGLSVGQVDMGAQNYHALIHKMASGRCDLFIDKRETIESLRLVDADLFKELMSGTFGVGTLKEDLPTGLHYAFSRQMPDGAVHLARFNAALADAKRHGEINRLAEPYLH